jgi:predicted small lipoprotein YifL
MRLFVVIALLALALQACGTKGGLYLPKPGAEDASSRKSR